MYMSLSAAEHKAHIGLPEDYTLDGLLTYGTWDLFAEKKQLPYLNNTLTARGEKYTLTRIEMPIIGHAYELLLSDGRKYWYAAVMGTPLMANYQHLASLMGSKKNILLGMVGGLAPGMRTGDLVLPKTSIGNDNARYYDRNNLSNIYLPDQGLYSRLKQLLTSRGLPFWEGQTNTCEMMLAETVEDVQTWSAAGILGVEMETAVTYALSKHFEVPAVALHYVADNLIENESMLSEAYKNQQTVRSQARTIQYQLGLELLLDG